MKMEAQATNVQSMLNHALISFFVATLVQIVAHLLTRKRSRDEAKQKRISEVIGNVVKAANDLQQVVIDYLTTTDTDPLKEHEAISRGSAISMRLEVLGKHVPASDFNLLMEICVDWQTKILGSVPREQSTALAVNSNEVLDVVKAGPWFEASLEAWCNDMLAGRRSPPRRPLLDALGRLFRRRQPNP